MNSERPSDGLADAFTFAIPPSAGGMLTQRMDDWRRAVDAAQRALALDSTLGPAHISLAIIRMHRDLDWDGAEAGFKRGLALAPDYAQGNDRYRSLLLATGRGDSAVAEARRAVALDPFSPFYLTNLGSSLLVAGHPEESLEVLDRMVAIDPAYRFGRDDRAVTFAILGDWDAAAEELKLYGLPASVADLYRAAMVDRANNSAFLSFLDQNPAFAASAPAQVAHMLAFIGEEEQAVDLLEQAVDDRVINALMTMKSWPTFASLQDNPRYQSLLRKSGLAD